jgi:hypothetical protein
MTLAEKVDKLNKIVDKAIMDNFEELEEAILPSLASLLVGYVELTMPKPTEGDKENIRYCVRSYGGNNEPVLLTMSYDLTEVLQGLEQSGISEWEMNTIIPMLPYPTEPTEEDVVH